MKKSYPLRELNANGYLISSAKIYGFVSSNQLVPHLFKKGDPSSVYLHFYKNSYIVSWHIIGNFQLIYRDSQSAVEMFKHLINIYSY